MRASSVLLSEESVLDLELGRQFYEVQLQGLGNDFVESALQDFDSLKNYAGIHPLHFGLHRLLLKRFPFAVYYELQSDVARIVAVLDTRRNPDRLPLILKSRQEG